MALTKVTGQVINDTTGLVVGVTTVGGGLSATDGFFSGITTITSTTESTSSTTGSLIISGGVGIAKNLSIGGSVSIGGTLTYEDVTNIDSVGLITARNGIVVGSGITLSKDGDIFATGVTTSTTFVGNLTGNVTGTADLATSVTVTANNSTDETVFPLFVDGATGTQGAETDTGLNYNPSTGRLTAVSYAGDGSNLTGISVGLTTEAYVVQAVSGITTFLDLSKDDHKITASGITTVDVRGGTEASSHTLRIENSGITTVGFSTYFLFPSGGTPNLPTTDGAISLISFTIHRAGAVGLATQLLAGASVNFS